MYEPEDRRKSCEISSSEQYTAIAVTNSQQVPALDLYKNEPVD